VVSDTAKRNCTLTLQARGLDAKKVYTVQLVKAVRNGKKTQTVMQGVGNAPFTLQVDNRGNGQLMYKPASCAALLSWSKIEVFLHPNKNPNGARRTPVLIGDLTKLTR
jgi:hypothetical protein